MELALKQGFEIRVVALPKGKDPADDPAGFEARLDEAEAYAVHRVRLELDRARDKQHAYLRVQDILNGDPRVARAARCVAAGERPARPHRSAAPAGQCRGRSRGVAEADRRGGEARARGARGSHRASRARRGCSPR